MTEQPMEQPVFDPTIGTMEQLTVQEKQLIDEAPSKTIAFLYNYVDKHGVPEYFSLKLDTHAGEPIAHVKFDGYAKVMAAIDYIDYLAESGIRKDFRV